MEQTQRKKKLTTSERMMQEAGVVDNTPPSELKPLTITEQIHEFIEDGESILLQGPPGIGKSKRVVELYPDLIPVDLSNNMLPEEIMGTLNYDTGERLPPDFVKQILDRCATDEEKALVKKKINEWRQVADEVYKRSKESDKKIVIFMDELLNVNPHVQDLVFSIVLDKVVKGGVKLPKNVVVVATGNPTRFSGSAYELSVPLQKRFHVINVKPNVAEWLTEFAIPHPEIIHPAITGFILSSYIKNKRCEDMNSEKSGENMSYFYEDAITVGEAHPDIYGGLGLTNDPRNWEEVSEMLYNYEKHLREGKYKGNLISGIVSEESPPEKDPVLVTKLKTKIRREWAVNFFNYYEYPKLTVKQIVNGDWTEDDLPENTDDRFTIPFNLLTATEEEVGKCRDFIRDYCDPEYLKVYDEFWAGNDPDKKDLIENLRLTDQDKKKQAYGDDFDNMLEL